MSAPDESLINEGPIDANADSIALEGDSERLKALIAQATLKYSVKDYDAAAELYAFATELQAEINGEMSPANADLLYAYGRCLYHVAVKNSDVLGSKVAGEAREETTKSTKDKQTTRRAESESADLKKEVAEGSNGASSAQAASDESKTEREGGKPYFQFTGDENFDTSDDDEVEKNEEGEGATNEEEGDEEEEDDFVVAYEVLDLARVLLQKKIEELSEEHGSDVNRKDESTSTGMGKAARQINERLADTYDLQAEISLEGERFPSAVVDLRSALTLKQQLYPAESSLIAEAHFKLSLALEFASITQQKDENGEVKPGTEAQVDEEMREEAAKELEAAIRSCKLRISQEEARLAGKLASSSSDDSLVPNGSNGTNSKTTTAEIDDVKEMVKDLQQRLVEIRQPPVSLTSPESTSIPLAGILGSVLGDSPAAQKAKIEEAARGANDLTGLVKRKKPQQPEALKSEATTSGTIPPTGDIVKVETDAEIAVVSSGSGSGSSVQNTNHEAGSNSGRKRKADELFEGDGEETEGKKTKV